MRLRALASGATGQSNAVQASIMARKQASVLAGTAGGGMVSPQAHHPGTERGRPAQARVCKHGNMGDGKARAHKSAVSLAHALQSLVGAGLVAAWAAGTKTNTRELRRW